MSRSRTDTAKRASAALRLAFAAAFALEAAWLFFADFGADIPRFAAQISAGIDALIAVALAAGFRPSNFAVFKTFAFAGFFAYAWYSLGTTPECAAAAAVSAALGLAVYTIL